MGKEESQWVKFQTTYILSLFKFKFKHLKFNKERSLVEIMWNRLGVFGGKLERQGAFYSCVVGQFLGHVHYIEFL